MGDEKQRAFADRLKDAVEYALAVIADRSVEQIKEYVSIPVEYVGGMVIRSVPGESPRRETGELQENIRWGDYNPGGNVIAGVAIGASRPSTPGVAAELEGSMKRPYMSKGASSVAKDGWATDIMVDHLRSLK